MLMYKEAIFIEMMVIIFRQDLLHHGDTVPAQIGTEAVGKLLFNLT
jgi:SOS-response transcriptional repressor LexA